MFKVLIGRQHKGGSTQQQADAVEAASFDLETQLNNKDLGVKSVQGIFVHDYSPLHTEVIAVVEIADSVFKKKGE